MTQFVKETINFVDFLYQALNISVVLSHLELWNDNNKINMSSKTDVNEVRQLMKILFNLLLNNCSRTAVEK